MKGAAVVLAIAAVACTPTAATDGPVIRAPASRPAPTTAPTRFTVVSFNVHFGGDPVLLANALRAGGLADADVYLLQEIEDHVPGEPKPRAEVLAAELGLAVIYAPARRLGHGGLGNHGLAVMSRWPIIDDVVLRLPDYHLLWSSRPRIAIGVLLDVAGTPVQVWNVHLDTRIAPEDRIAQLVPVFDRARALPAMAIVGGDFNTWARIHQRALDGLAAEQGFDTPTAELTDSQPGGLITWPPRPAFRLDAIYTRGFAILDAGVDRAVRGSDHLPIWVQLQWPRPLP